MKILALEFSSPQRSVALVDTANRGESLVEHEAIETGALSNKPFEMIQDVLQKAGVDRERVDRIAVGLGPGSYNGIRIAIAIAQGWDLAKSVEVQGISSAECVAEEARAQGIAGPISVVIDAQRGEYYLASFIVSGTESRQTEPLRLVCKANVLEREKAGDQLVGPEVCRWFATGRTVFPRAATLARLSAGRSEVVSSQQLEPIYLRMTTFVKAPPPRVLPGDT